MQIGRDVLYTRYYVVYWIGDVGRYSIRLNCLMEMQAYRCEFAPVTEWKWQMPPDYDALKQAFGSKSYILTAHGSDRAAKRRIRSPEIEQAVLSGEVIEDYPDDKYGPSCLILGYTDAKRPLHIQVSYPPHVKVITVYEPLADEWEADLRTRQTNE